MKNKSGNHKSTNRFKFVTFTEHINSIDIRKSALYRIEHINADKPEDNETHFHNTLVRWKILNLTTEFLNFAKRVENIVTLPQLLHRKDEVVSLLLENLDRRNVLTLQPFLELVVVLAKDLQDDFYAYFTKFLDCLVRLLNTKDPEQLEWTLICLAFLFKALKAYLKRDITVVFKSILPLLSDSTKWYIRNFAAESFAFVARDVKDKKKFVEKLVKIVQSNDDAIVGCGHLLFEVVHGVGNQFHSCSEVFFPIFFNALRDSSIDQKTLFNILTQTVGDMLEIINSKQSDPFWKNIIESVNMTINIQKLDGNKIGEYEGENKALEYILLLIGQSLEHAQGKFLCNPLPLLNLIGNLVDTELAEKTYQTVSQIGILILLCTHINLPHENAVTLVKKLISIPHPRIVTDFVQEVVSSPSFDMIVFPHFIESISTFNSDVIKALSKICLEKSPLCKNGSDIYTWVKYPIDFGFKCNSCYHFLVNAINQDIDKILESPDDCINSLICLPHIKHLDMNEIKTILKSLIYNLIIRLKSLDNTQENENSVRNLLFCLAVSVECAIHIIKPENVDEVCHTNDIILTLSPYLSDHRYICSLRILDVILTIKESEHLLQYDILNIIHDKLEKNLHSTFHEVRFLTTHIYSLFETILHDFLQPMKKKMNNCDDDSNIKTLSNKKESFKMFSLCHAVESLSLSVETYREQLLKLSKASHDSLQYRIVKDTEYKHFALKFMIGFLNVNFKLLWEPLQNLILTFANGLPANDFWEVFYPCLEQAVENVRNDVLVIVGSIGFCGKSTHLQSIFSEYFDLNDKPDYSLYRLHLLEVLQQASPLCEVKNKDVTMLFLDFMKFEFNKPHLVNIYDESEMDIVEEDEKNDDSKVEEEEEDLDKLTISKSTYDALIGHLKIYSNIQNPKSFYKEQNLHAIYYDFLMHKNPIIQKLALDCLLRYKNKHVTPYKDRLYNLIDGKKFKEELRTFKLESDSECIHVDDRDELMPIILRIAFSKMITNTGIDKKGGSQMRRSLVMRFLSGCTEDELITFTDMAFKVFIDYINLDSESLCTKMNETYSSLTTLAPKRLLGCLNLLENMRQQFIKPGESKLLSKLIRIVLCIGAFIKNVLNEPEKIKHGYASILKNIRGSCIQSIGNFFKQLDQWTWTECDLLSIYNIFIWPIIEKLPIEGIHSPTPLLKLFSIWSQCPRFHIFFNVCNLDEKTVTILPYILRLLESKKLHYSVNEMCLTILEKLLTLEYTEDNLIQLSNDIMLTIDDEIIVNLNLKENLNVGSRILIPHIPMMVPILKEKYSNTNAKKLLKRDITILSRITEMVYDSASVDILLRFSLPILIQRIGASDLEENLETSVEALTRLLSKTSSPKTHILTVIPLFSKVTTARARKLLCESLMTLASHCGAEVVETLSITANIVTEMNASDEKWLEQPDFERRLAVYKRIYQMTEEDCINIELASLIVHNCFFTIAHSNDISLRSSASDCLQKIVPKLIIKFKDQEFFTQDTVMNLIKNGLKSDNDNLKVETIAFLGELVRECPKAISTFSELYPLTNKANKEIDFFENLQHLQVHRKIRAFLKFCNHAKTLTKAPSPKTLMQIILPLASQYICNEKYADKYSLVEAAMDTIGIICRLLPWRQYEIILKMYLNKLHRSVDHQKQLIKLISFILDAFHFDLSKAGNIEKLTTEVALDTSQKNDDMEIDESKIDDDVDMKEVDSTTVVAFDRIQMLSPSAAKRVIHTITNDILKELNWTSSQISEHEASHKSLRKDNSTQREADDKLRIPMGFAIVKLLQKLPHPMLHNNILGILIKIIYYLKSPLINVRASARDIISKIMVTVGTKYLNMLMSNLSALLTRGIHVHVLILTVHTVLEALENKFGPCEMDKYFDNILKICLNDLFGIASEEKEVVKIGNKAPEAKPSKKSYLTIRIIAQNISDKCIVNLLSPFKNVILNTHSKRTVLRVETCFQHISTGLTNNPNISIESCLIFLCGVLSESIPKFSTVKKIKPEPIYLDEKRPSKPDCYLIPPNPKGSKNMPKKRQARMSSQANAHVIIEFGLNLLHVILQKDKINSMDCRPYLDPMVPFILDALNNSQVKIATLGLRVISSIWVKKLNLPTLKNKIEDALESIFKILHKYATSGLSKKDENFHLVSNSFKAMTSFIRNVNYHSLDIAQTKTLLMYAEHDIHDYEKQGTAFLLLKAILAAKYNLGEINVIMKKVLEISITNESPRAREESSQVLIAYMMNYPSSKVIKQYIEFYVKNLEYELEHGRLSAIKVLQLIVDNFPEDTLTKHSSFLFVSLGMRLVNEISMDCKALIICCIEKILQRITLIKRNELFNVITVLLSDINPVHIEMASQLCSRFVAVEKADFKNRLDILIPKISEKLYGDNSNVGRFVKLSKKSANYSEESKDSSFIEMLNLLARVCENCPSVFNENVYDNYIDEIGNNCQKLLAHSHALVRLNAVEYLTIYFKSLNALKLANIVQNQSETNIVFCHTVDSLKSLTLDLCSQLIPGGVSSDLASSVCKSISLLLNIVSNFSTVEQKDDNIDQTIDCVWIAKKVKSAINSEVAKSPSCTIVRFSVFGMLDELVNLLSVDPLLKVTQVLMSCLLREMSRTDATFEDLKNRAVEVGSNLNSKLGSVSYNEVVSKAQAKLSHKRKERKLKIAQDKVNHPERAAKRKIFLQDKKRKYKKRKMDKMKGRIPNKRMKPAVAVMEED